MLDEKGLSCDICGKAYFQPVGDVVYPPVKVCDCEEITSGDLVMCIQVEKSWGKYEVLSDSPGHKVKRLTVNPSAKLSLQSHEKRDEHWFIVQGAAIVELDNNTLMVKPGESVNIKRGQKHRAVSYTHLTLPTNREV